MTSDDKTEALVGHVLTAIEACDLSDRTDDYGNVHEMCFVDIKTEDGVAFTLTTHVEHNGYYGGFSLTLHEVPNR